MVLTLQKGEFHILFDCHLLVVVLAGASFIALLLTQALGFGVNSTTSGDFPLALCLISLIRVLGMAFFVRVWRRNAIWQFNDGRTVLFFLNSDHFNI